MTSFLLRRLLQAAVIVAVIVVLVFVVMRISAGDPARLRAPVFASSEVIEQYQRDFGTDRSLPEQLAGFLIDMSGGDLGTSFRFQEPVSDLILRALPNTLLLAGFSLAIALSLTLTLGCLAAVNPRSGWAWLSSALATIGQSAPVFWTGALMVILFAVQLDWLPSGGYSGFSSLILPAVAIAFSILPTQLRVLRSAMEETLREEFIETSRAFGLGRRRIIFVYALKNAILPLMTVVGVDIGYLLGGVIVAEVVFAFPGLGELALTALKSRDYPLIQGVTIVTASAFVVVNLLIDLAYYLVDPRIELDKL